MSMSEAFDWSVLVLAPFLLLAGGFFSLAQSASAFVHLAAKGIAWLLSIPVGMMLGAALSNSYLPEWGGWGVAYFFGYGFFSVWILAGIAGHDDLTHHYPGLLKSLGKKLRKEIKKRSEKPKSDGAQYKARAKRKQG